MQYPRQINHELHLGSRAPPRVHIISDYQETHKHKYNKRNKITLYSTTISVLPRRFVLLRASTVVFCTVQVSSRQMVARQAIQTVILDESCQVTEAASLLHLRSEVRRLIEVGDAHQLPPVVKSPAAKAAGLAVSRFERLELLGHRPAILDVQYRMHPSILSFPNAAFYEGRVLTAASVLGRSPCPWLEADHPSVSATDRHRFGPMRIFDTSRAAGEEYDEERGGRDRRARVTGSWHVLFDLRVLTTCLPDRAHAQSPPLAQKVSWHLIETSTRGYTVCCTC